SRDGRVRAPRQRRAVAAHFRRPFLRERAVRGYRAFRASDRRALRSLRLRLRRRARRGQAALGAAALELPWPSAAVAPGARWRRLRERHRWPLPLPCRDRPPAYRIDRALPWLARAA